MAEMITINIVDYPDFPCQDCVERDVCPKTHCGSIRRWKEKNIESIKETKKRIK